MPPHFNLISIISFIVLVFSNHNLYNLEMALALIITVLGALIAGSPRYELYNDFSDQFVCKKADWKKYQVKKILS